MWPAHGPPPVYQTFAHPRDAIPAIILLLRSHEVETDSDGVMFKAYNARFWTPAVNARGPSNGTWYSFDAGMVHWVMVRKACKISL